MDMILRRSWVVWAATRCYMLGWWTIVAVVGIVLDVPVPEPAETGSWALQDAWALARGLGSWAGRAAAATMAWRTWKLPGDAGEAWRMWEALVARGTLGVARLLAGTAAEEL